MTSHIHLIIGTSNADNALEGTIRDLKSYTSRKLREAIENSNIIQESRREWILQMMYHAGKYNANNNDFHPDSYP